jgi:hypothetical protein
VSELERQSGPQQPPELDPSPAPGAPSREEPADVSELEQQRGQQQPPPDLHPSPAPGPE